MTGEQPPVSVLLQCSDPGLAHRMREILGAPHFALAETLEDAAYASPDPADLVVWVVDSIDTATRGVWRASPSWIAVLAFVAGDEPGLDAAALAAGADSVLWLPEDDGVLRDAVTRAASRAKLHADRRDELQRYRDLVQHAPIGVFELRDGRLSYVNDHLLDRLGYERDQLIGEPAERLLPVLPEEKARIREEVEQRAHGIGNPTPRIYHFTTSTGGTYIGETRSRRVSTPDGPIIEGTIRDITLETRLTQLQRIVIELGEVILGESDIDRILQLVLDTIVEYSGFRRAVLSLYDLSIPVPFEGEVYKILSSGLTPTERAALLSQPPISVNERTLVFSERYRLGPAYYIPHNDTPWSSERGISGRVAVEGWHVDDFLFLPLRGTTGIIGSISVDDPIDRSVPTLASIEPVAALANFAALAVERVFKMRQLHKHKEQLHGLAEFGGPLTRVHDVRTLCELAVQRAHQDMDYGLCSIWIVDGMRLIHEAVAADELFSTDDIPRKGARAHVDGPGIARWAFRDRQAIVVPNVLEEKRYAGPSKVIRSVMAVPILGRKGPTGVIEAASDRIAAFSDQDVEVVSALAGQISTAISALHRRDALTRIYSFGQRLATASTREQAVTSTLDFLVEQFDFELSAILLQDGPEVLTVAALHGPFHDGGIQVGAMLPSTQGIIGWVATHRQPLLVGDVDRDERYHEGFSGTRSELAVPILFGSQLLGVIDVESQQPQFFDDEDRQLLDVVANHLAIALSNMASQDHLRQQAIRDPLTGLFNRHYFHSTIAAELGRADRYDRPLSLMMIDIDGFRTVNNHFGHLRGDEVLCEIARMLQGTVREADRIIRYGGDEFLVLMPETDRESGCATVIERLRARIGELPEHAGLVGHTIDLSIGLYTRPPHDPRTLEEMLEEVDRRMYADKRGKHVNADRG